MLKFENSVTAKMEFYALCLTAVNAEPNWTRLQGSAMFAERQSPP
jgi:hypothetical protein